MSRRDLQRLRSPARRGLRAAIITASGLLVGLALRHAFVCRPPQFSDGDASQFFQQVAATPSSSALEGRARALVMWAGTSGSQEQISDFERRYVSSYARWHAPALRLALDGIAVGESKLGRLQCNLLMNIYAVEPHDAFWRRESERVRKLRYCADFAKDPSIRATASTLQSTGP